MTLRPGDLIRADAEAVLAAGVSRRRACRRVHVAALFNMIVRLADSLGWDVPPYERVLRARDAMLESGYALEEPG